MGSLKYPITGSGVFTSVATQAHPLGTKGEDNYGRTFRYALAGGTNLVVANVIQSPALIANHEDLTPSAAAIGDRSITLVAGATAGGADLYGGGLAVINTTPGLGYAYPISGHLAFDNSGATVIINLARGWEIVIALTTSSRVTLVPNPYRDVIQHPTVETGMTCGICVFIITTLEFGWLCVGGPVGVLMDASTPLAGTALCASEATAGAVEEIDTDSILQVIGSSIQVGVSADVQPMHCQIG